MHNLMYIDYLFHCQRLATRSKSTILIVLKCLQTEVCSGRTTIIYQLEGSGMLKKNDLHSDTSLHLHCNDVHEQTMGQTFYCIIRINSILYTCTLYNTKCA